MSHLHGQEDVDDGHDEPRRHVPDDGHEVVVEGVQVGAGVQVAVVQQHDGHAHGPEGGLVDGVGQEVGQGEQGDGRHGQHRAQPHRAHPAPLLQGEGPADHQVPGHTQHGAYNS